MVDGRLKLEYAKSARAACPLCGSTIAKGDVRIGREKMVNGWAQVKWHHPNCFGEHHPEADFAQAAGFLSLKTTDQKALRSIGENSKKASEQKPPDIHSVSREGVVVKSSAELTGLPGFDPSKILKTYRDIALPEGWTSFSTLIFNAADNAEPSEKIAAFDFDGTLVDTSVLRQGADAWSLLYDSIPTKLASFYNQGYKLVIFTNESNIDRFTKARAKAIDSKLGRLKGFMQAVTVPMQVFIACGKSGSNDVFRKPATGMWYLLEKYLNTGLPIDRERSFYVGDAAGRRTDHSDADSAFAKVLGLKFLLPEDVFLPESDAIGGDTAQDQEEDKSKESHGTPSDPPTDGIDGSHPCPEDLNPISPGTP
ncbi:unnamed protein product [Calypogeia fissa]